MKKSMRRKRKRNKWLGKSEIGGEVREGRAVRKLLLEIQKS
jgi:hypothetical protein